VVSLARSARQVRPVGPARPGNRMYVVVHACARPGPRYGPGHRGASRPICGPGRAGYAGRDAKTGAPRWAMRRRCGPGRVRLSVSGSARAGAQPGRLDSSGRPGPVFACIWRYALRSIYAMLVCLRACVCLCVRACACVLICDS
jgi:hypothetical protein